MSRADHEHHPFRFLGSAFLIILCLPLAVFLAFFAAPVFLVILPLFVLWGAERSSLKRPEHDLSLRRVPRVRRAH
jgi:hypothetical protein